MSEQEATLDQFGKNTESKQSDEWQYVQLGDVSKKRSDNVDPQKVELDRHVGLEHILPNTPSPRWESLNDLSSTKRRFKAGDVLFAKLRPNLEKSAQPDFDGVSSSDIFPIVANDGINSKFLLYRLSSKPAYDYARRTSAGTRMPRTSWNLFSNFEFGLPSLTEQRKIATILYTVDQAIEKTEEIIGQYERVTNGLQRTLLREGPDLGESTQSTPTGQYPSLWKMVRAGEYLDLRNGEFLSKDDRDESGKYPVYGGNGIMGYTDESTVGEDTLVIGRVGAYCGNIHITKSDAWVTDNAIVVTQLSDEYMPRFLAYLLDEIGLGQFSEQSAQPRISQSTVENLRIPKPPIEDQSDIVEKLDSVETAKETE